MSQKYFAPNAQVKLTEDHVYHQTIFINAEVSNPEKRTLLKKGTIVKVSCHYKDGGVECVKNGAYYVIDENILAAA